MLACHCGEKSMRILLDAGADINLKANPNQMEPKVFISPLQYAQKHARPWAVEFLLKNGAIIRRQTAESLAMAAANSPERQKLENNCQIIQAYIANMYLSGSKGSSAYRIAIKREITDYLQHEGTETALQFLRELEASGFKRYL